MFRSHLLLEPAAVERLGGAALLAGNQCRADGLDVRVGYLVTANEVADVLAVIGEFTCSDPETMTWAGPSSGA